MTSLWLDRPRPAYTDPWPDDATVDDLVVGAGLTGMCTALLLARAGRRVAVVEARQVGGVTTGNTTGKVSLLQGTTLSGLQSSQSREVREAYVDANREGMEWLLRFCDEHGVPYQRRAAITYASTPAQVKSVRAEHEAARELGLPTRLVDRLDVPFPHHGAVVLDDQAQLDAWEVLAALAEEVRRHGGTIHEGRRATSAAASAESVRTTFTDDVRTTFTDDSELRARHLVLATGIPMLDRSLHFARVEPMRSYALAFEHATPPDGMFLSAGSPGRSIRDAPGSGGRLLLVGGAGHTVGRNRRPTSEHYDELREWTHEHFPGAVETHAWSAQDYRSHTGVPLVGRIPLGGGAVYGATGYGKWGLTNGVAAAHAIAAEILGSRAPGESGNPLQWRAVLEVARLNAEVGALLTLGHLGALAQALPVPAGRRGERPPVCTHLGGRLKWNDAEGSWDCPLHGSRFAADGSVLEGPATRPICLDRRNLQP